MPIDTGYSPTRGLGTGYGIGQRPPEQAVFPERQRGFKAPNALSTIGDTLGALSLNLGGIARGQQPVQNPFLDRLTAQIDENNAYDAFAGSADLADLSLAHQKQVISTAETHGAEAASALLQQIRATNAQQAFQIQRDEAGFANDKELALLRASLQGGGGADSPFHVFANGRVVRKSDGAEIRGADATGASAGSQFFSPQQFGDEAWLISKDGITENNILLGSFPTAKDGESNFEYREGERDAYYKVLTDKLGFDDTSANLTLNQALNYGAESGAEFLGALLKEGREAQAKANGTGGDSGSGISNTSPTGTKTDGEGNIIFEGDNVGGLRTVLTPNGELLSMNDGGQVVNKIGTVESMTTNNITPEQEVALLNLGASQNEINAVKSSYGVNQDLFVEQFGKMMDGVRTRANAQSDLWQPTPADRQLAKDNNISISAYEAQDRNTGAANFAKAYETEKKRQAEYGIIPLNDRFGVLPPDRQNYGSGLENLIDNRSGRRVQKWIDGGERDIKNRASFDTSVKIFDIVDTLYASPELASSLSIEGTYARIASAFGFEKEAAFLQAKDAQIKAQGFIDSINNTDIKGALSDAEGRQLSIAFSALTSKLAPDRYRDVLVEIGGYALLNEARTKKRRFDKLDRYNDELSQEYDENITDPKYVKGIGFYKKLAREQLELSLQGNIEGAVEVDDDTAKDAGLQ